MTEKRCAIVTYTMRKAAEEAASNLYKKLKIKGCSLKLWWARAPSEDRGPGGKGGGMGGGGGRYAPPPPGMAPPPPGQPGGSATFYPSMNPSAMGSSRPD